MRCQTCDNENPDGSAYCNKCGAAIGIATRPAQSTAIPSEEKKLVFEGPFSTRIYSKSQLNIRIFFEVAIAIICIIGGFYFGQPLYGILLGAMALGFGYVIYLLSTEAS
jgi:hypothetical protein